MAELNEDKKLFQLTDYDGKSMGLLRTNCPQDIVEKEWEYFMENINEVEELESFDTDIESFISYMLNKHNVYEFDRDFYEVINP